MKRIPFFPGHASSQVPRLAWLEITHISLHIAYDLFTWSRRLNHFALLEWAAVRVLRFACRALGHAPASSYIEFRADLPAQI